MTATFVKHYRSPSDATTAASYHAWLARYASPFRQPALLSISADCITFERITGRHACSADLPRLAALLGGAHGSAWTSALRSASLTVPHPVPGGTIGDYLTCRRQALHRRLDDGHLSGRPALRRLLALLEDTATGPAAFYKDSNPRNFLMTSNDGWYIVDPDDVTLAPFGYDLAKLLVTLAMTYGPLPTDALSGSLHAYNQAAARHADQLTVTPDRLTAYLVLNQILNAPYAGQHGYLPTSSSGRSDPSTDADLAGAGPTWVRRAS